MIIIIMQTVETREGRGKKQKLSSKPEKGYNEHMRESMCMWMTEDY